MNALGRTLDVLTAHDLHPALIGASAMAAHGVARATMDVDLLLVGRRALDSPAWETLREKGAGVEVRRGGGDDPLVGVVRVEFADEPPIDVIVGSQDWQQRVIERAIPTDYLGTKVPIASACDLILLKLYAGSPQDRWDITRLLSAANRDALAQAVERDFLPLPKESRELWRAIVAGR